MVNYLRRLGEWGHLLCSTRIQQEHHDMTTATDTDEQLQQGSTPAASASAPAPTAQPVHPIDHKSYPHILELILNDTDLSVLLTFRATSSAFLERMNNRILNHTFHLSSATNTARYLSIANFTTRERRVIQKITIPTQEAVTVPPFPEASHLSLHIHYPRNSGHQRQNSYAQITLPKLPKHVTFLFTPCPAPPGQHFATNSRELLHQLSVHIATSLNSGGDWTFVGAEGWEMASLIHDPELAFSIAIHRAIDEAEIAEGREPLGALRELHAGCVERHVRNKLLAKYRKSHEEVDVLLGNLGWISEDEYREMIGVAWDEVVGL